MLALLAGQLRAVQGGKDDKAGLVGHPVWMVDPLDGTREFSEARCDDWAVVR